MRVHLLPTLLIAVCVLALTPGLDAGLARPQSKATSRPLYKVINRDGKTGFIDKTGRLVIGFDRFPGEVEIGDFHEGLATICFLVQGHNACSAVGYIDQNGEMAIAPRFKQAWDFSEGLAYVESDELKGFIDREGKLVIRLAANQQCRSDFYEGRAAIFTPEGQGFIDRSGKVVVEPRYSHVRPFSEGLAAVGSGNPWKDMKYGFIDKDGKTVIPPRFEARVEGSPYSGGRIDTSRFSEGLARVRVGGLYGYINQKGDLVIPPKFALAGDFSEGLASAVENDKVGYIDKRGKWVIPPRYDVPAYSIYQHFGDGLVPVAVTINDATRWGYVDHTDKMVIPPTLANAFPFKDGVATVYVLDPSGRSMAVRYIDTAGRFLWEPK
ncbi:MAG: hypothetical protein V7641_5538 [Blastocatellia bacterium]